MHIINNNISCGQKIVRVPSVYFTTLDLSDNCNPNKKEEQALPTCQNKTLLARLSSVADRVSPAPIPPVNKED